MPPTSPVRLLPRAWYTYYTQCIPALYSRTPSFYLIENRRHRRRTTHVGRYIYIYIYMGNNLPTLHL